MQLFKWKQVKCVYSRDNTFSVKVDSMFYHMIPKKNCEWDCCLPASISNIWQHLKRYYDLSITKTVLYKCMFTVKIKTLSILFSEEGL